MKTTKILQKTAKNTLIKAGIELLDKNPEKNMYKLFALIKKSIRKDKYNLAKIEKIENLYKTNTGVHKLVMNVIRDSNKKCKNKFFVNFLENAVWHGMTKREKFLKEKGIKLPFTIFISPSMRCNLTCRGCYTSSYSEKDDIPEEEVDRIIKEARDLGIYFFVIFGGEPFINSYMLKIYNKYNDCIFVTLSNGTLFDRKLADNVQKLGNVIPIFSIEGFEKETDIRRGKGAFSSVINAMKLLKTKGVLFGTSTIVNKYNIYKVVSDEFIDMLVESGAKMGWYFTFIPVDKEHDVNLMLTSEKRICLSNSIRKIRNTKPYFAVDFFNDIPYVGGYVEEKNYCHVNFKEDVEYCIFVHFSTNNLKGKRLVDVFNSNSFKKSTYGEFYNLLLPCMKADIDSRIT